MVEASQPASQPYSHKVSQHWEGRVELTINTSCKYPHIYIISSIHRRGDCPSSFERSFTINKKKAQIMHMYMYMYLYKMLQHFHIANGVSELALVQYLVGIQ